MDAGKTHPVGRVVNLDGKYSAKTCKMLSELNEPKEEIAMRELKAISMCRTVLIQDQPKL